MERIFDSIIFLSICVVLSQCKTVSSDGVRKFPDGFKFGTATAAYQVEGAWDADGKTENIWDRLTHTRPEMVLDSSNGDIAGNSYYLYERDVEMMRELGLDFYRFSLSWTRILSNSFPNEINEAGVAYYNNLINEMLKYNIQPMITLYHWDLPQKLQDLGGWANPEMVNWFSDYARVVFELFGDRVKYWITINEPHQVCHYGYGSTYLAPAIDMPGIPEYMCAKNVLVAHAKSYHIYNEEFRPTQEGSIFISFSAQWYEPANESFVEAAYVANQFWWAVYTHPIFSKTGDFPPVMKQRIAKKSAAEGFPRSRLPEFTPEEIKLVRGTSDFFGVNHYSSYYVYVNESTSTEYDVPSLENDLGVSLYQPEEWQIGESSYTMYVPWGFYKLLTHIRNEYGNPPVIVTENGFATYGELKDDDRVKYYRGYLDAMLDAIDEGSNIKAYTAWSLMDNFEWFVGYTECFGLYDVDYNDINRTRTARKSAYVFKEIIRTKTLNPNYEPDMSQPISIDEGH